MLNRSQNFKDLLPKTQVSWQNIYFSVFTQALVSPERSTGNPKQQILGWNNLWIWDSAWVDYCYLEHILWNNQHMLCFGCWWAGWAQTGCLISLTSKLYHTMLVDQRHRLSPNQHKPAWKLMLVYAGAFHSNPGLVCWCSICCVDFIFGSVPVR